MALHPKGRHSLHTQYGKLTLSPGECGHRGFLMCCYFVNYSDEKGSAGEFAVFHIMSRILEAANGMCMPLPPGKFCFAVLIISEKSSAINSSQQSTGCSTCQVSFGSIDIYSSQL